MDGQQKVDYLKMLKGFLIDLSCGVEWQHSAKAAGSLPFSGAL